MGQLVQGILMGTTLVQRGITRYDIDEQGTYGFMVRISRQGVQTNEFFSDKNHKGKRKARSPHKSGTKS